MKDYIVGKTLDYIYAHKEYTDLEKDTIGYGISNLYLQLTKTIVITSIAIVLKIFVPYLIFTILYNIIRMPSFGVHAKKSWHCWVSSIIIFNIIPYLTKIISLETNIKIIVLLISVLYMTYYSPADTEKRPIISHKRRMTYKSLSCILSIIYSLFCLFIKDQIVSNALLFSLILQCIIISPSTYKLFGQPYNNYKNYLGKEE